MKFQKGFTLLEIKGKNLSNMRNKKKFLTGFTLIELLVVIAIIGILASIVLVSFPGAQKKANDSRVISAIAQARTVMTYYEANAGTLVGFSCTSEDMPNLCAEVVKNSLGGVALSITIVGTGSSAAACMSAPLRATSGQHYCADSTGKAGRTTGTGGVICNATTAVCNGTLID